MSEPPPAVPPHQDKEEEKDAVEGGSPDKPPPHREAPNSDSPPSREAPPATYSVLPRAIVSKVSESQLHTAHTYQFYPERVDKPYGFRADHPGPGLARGGKPVSSFVDPYVGRRVAHQRDYRPYERYWTQAPTSYVRAPLEGDSIYPLDDTDLDTAGRATSPARIVPKNTQPVRVAVGRQDAAQVREAEPHIGLDDDSTPARRSKSPIQRRSATPVDHAATRTQGVPTTHPESPTHQAPPSARPRTKSPTRSERATLESYYPMLSHKFGPAPPRSLQAKATSTRHPPHGSPSSSSSSPPRPSSQDLPSPAPVPPPGWKAPAPAPWADPLPPHRQQNAGPSLPARRPTPEELLGPPPLGSRARPAPPPHLAAPPPLISPRASASSQSGHDRGSSRPPRRFFSARYPQPQDLMPPPLMPKIPGTGGSASASSRAMAPPTVPLPALPTGTSRRRSPAPPPSALQGGSKERPSEAKGSSSSATRAISPLPQRPRRTQNPVRTEAEVSGGHSTPTKTDSAMMPPPKSIRPLPRASRTATPTPQAGIQQGGTPIVRSSAQFAGGAAAQPLPPIHRRSNEGEHLRSAMMPPPLAPYTPSPRPGPESTSSRGHKRKAAPAPAPPAVGGATSSSSSREAPPHHEQVYPHGGSMERSTSDSGVPSHHHRHSTGSAPGAGASDHRLRSSGYNSDEGRPRALYSQGWRSYEDQYGTLSSLSPVDVIGPSSNLSRPPGTGQAYGPRPPQRPRNSPPPADRAPAPRRPVSPEQKDDSSEDELPDDRISPAAPPRWHPGMPPHQRPK